MPAIPEGLGWRQKASLAAHLFKAVARRHHRKLEPLLRQVVPAGGVVLDVGAHAGQFTKLFARIAPGVRVHAVEPGSYARFVLTTAIRVLALNNVTVHALALSDHEGEADLLVPLKRGGVGFGLGHLGGGEEARSTIRERVPVTTLDALAVRLALDRLDLIKADVEGGEAAIIAGGRETLARFRPALLIEIDSSRLARAGSAPAEIWSALEALGYDGRRIGDAGALAASGDRGDGDYLFRAESSG